MNSELKPTLEEMVEKAYALFSEGCTISYNRPSYLSEEYNRHNEVQREIGRLIQLAHQSSRRRCLDVWNEIDRIQTGD